MSCHSTIQSRTERFPHFFCCFCCCAIRSWEEESKRPLNRINYDGKMSRPFISLCNSSLSCGRQSVHSSQLRTQWSAAVAIIYLFSIFERTRTTITIKTSATACEFDCQQHTHTIHRSFGTTTFHSKPPVIQREYGINRNETVTEKSERKKTQKRRQLKTVVALVDVQGYPP